MRDVVNQSLPDARQKLPLPLALRVVAWTFIVTGAIAAYDVAAALVHGRIMLNVIVLGLLIGPGILLRSPTWRAVGALLIGVFVGAMPVMMVAFGSPDGRFSFTFAGLRYGDFRFSFLGMPYGPVVSIGAIGTGMVWVLASLLWVFLVWQLWVLCRLSTRRLFDPVRRWHDLAA